MIQAKWQYQQTVNHTVLAFSGGEVQVRIVDPDRHKLASQTSCKLTPLQISAHLTQPADVMELVLLTDALRRLVGERPIDLICPYLPYARQDRVCAPGESLALREMCGILNSLHFRTVTVWDVHSDVSLALLDRVENIPPELLMPIPPENTVLVAPDAGAMKKVQKVAKHVKLPMVTAEKVRSVDTGEITGTKVHSGHIGDANFLIVDDICDGGRTFIELGKVLRPLTNGKVELYVTHGIFSKGLEVFDGILDHIYVAAPFPGVDLTNPILIQTHARLL